MENLNEITNIIFIDCHKDLLKIMDTENKSHERFDKTRFGIHRQEYSTHIDNLRDVYVLQ